MLSGKPMEKQEFRTPKTNGAPPAPKARKPKKAKPVPDPLAEVENLSLFYGAKQALREINMTSRRGRSRLLSALRAAANPRCFAALTA